MSEQSLREMQRRMEEYVAKLPGKRGIDIPEHAYDTILATAQSRTLPLWGQQPTPQHMQAFYDAGAHENPALIHGFYESLPHPHAPSLSVGEYQGWAEAHKTWEEHAK